MFTSSWLMGCLVAIAISERGVRTANINSTMKLVYLA